MPRSAAVTILILNTNSLSAQQIRFGLTDGGF